VEKTLIAAISLDQAMVGMPLCVKTWNLIAPFDTRFGNC